MIAIKIINDFETHSVEFSNIDVSLEQYFQAFTGMLVANGWSEELIQKHIIELAKEYQKGINEEFEISRKEIDSLKSKNVVMQWVAVSERLPEINQHVLVLRTSPNIVTTGYIHKYGYWIWSNLNGSTHKADHIYKVTHWMPLPEPPCA